MPSHNLAKITIDDLDIIGYSVAGEETVIGMPQLDVCFDIGKAPDQIIPINHVLLTHGHMDHAAGIGYYLSHRKFCGQTPGTLLAPANLLPPGWTPAGAASGGRRPSGRRSSREARVFSIRPCRPRASIARAALAWSSRSEKWTPSGRSRGTPPSIRLPGRGGPSASG